MKFIDDVTIQNKRVLVRVDFNVSLDPKRHISNDVRIQQSLPTIRHLLEQGNTVILLSHLGQPQGRDEKLSLDPVAKRLKTYLPTTKISLVPDLKSLLAEKTRKAGSNHLFLLENIRFFSGEKTNNPDFAKKLAQAGEIYVNDAFGVCHRTDASVVGIPQYLPSYGGMLLKKELSMLSPLLANPKKPVVSIIGGAKISTKIKLLKKLLTISDVLLLGGGIANTFLLAQGHETGKSLVEDEAVNEAHKLISFAHHSHCALILPHDAIVENSRTKKSQVKPISRLLSTDNIVDIGPETEAIFGEKIARAHTIIWNGPVGMFEKEAYKRGTDFIYYAIANNKKATSIVGGGETIAALTKKEHLERISHISTGGGAMLAFIENGTLPGIEALG